MSQTRLSQAAVEADLHSARFCAGVVRRRWRIVELGFPFLVLGVAAVTEVGAATEYFFRFELSGFPATAPEVCIWDPKTNSRLPTDKRPRGSTRLVEAFKDWGKHTVYRPWDRLAGAHNNWAREYPQLAWHGKRDLTFILEDLHALLSSNNLAQTLAS